MFYKFFQNYILCLFTEQNDLSEEYLITSNNDQDIIMIQPTSQKIIRD